MEKREGPLTFNELKKELKDYSEFNFLKYGKTQSGGALTLKKFREMLVQLRIVKGQNANSIYTEKEFEEMGYDIPKDAIPFYNGKGEKCYDVAYAPNTSKGIGNLQFEDTLENTFSGKAPKKAIAAAGISKNDFQKLNRSMKKVFGVGMDTTSSNILDYKTNFVRNIGRRILNVITRNNVIPKRTGTLYLEKAKFTAPEGSPERAKEEAVYYRDAISKYMDHVSQSMIKISYGDYKKELLGLKAFQALSENEKAEQLTKHKQAFAQDREVINMVARDLAISEMVKTLPNVDAKTRYELSQAYVLRASQNISRIDLKFADNSVLLRTIFKAVEQPVVKYNLKNGYTPHDVFTLYSQIGQSPKETVSISGIIFGDASHTMVNNFDYTFVAPTKTADKETEKSEEKIKARVINKYPEKIVPAKNAEIAKKLTSSKDRVADETPEVKVGGLYEVPEDVQLWQWANAKRIQAKEQKTVEESEEQEQTEDGTKKNRDKFVKDYKRKRDTWRKKPEQTDEQVDEQEQDEEKSNKHRQKLIDDYKKKRDTWRKRVVKTEDPNLKPGHTDEKITTPKDFANKTEEQVRKLVKGYLVKNTEPLINKEAVKAMGDEEKEIGTRLSQIDSLFKGKHSKVNQKEAEKTIETNLADNKEENKALKEAAQVIVAIEENINEITEKVVVDWKKAKEAKSDAQSIEWLETHTLDKFLTYWLDNVNERDLYPDSQKLKTFRGCYQADFRKDLREYSKGLAEEIAAKKTANKNKEESLEV